MGEELNHERAARELVAVVSQQGREIAETIANATRGFLIDDLPDDSRRNDLFDSLSGRGQLQIATGFTEQEVLSLHQCMRPFCITVRQSGAKPKSSWLDMLVCYLSWAKLSLDYLKLSVVLGSISASRLEDNIGRIRPVLKTTLFQKWFDSPLRPRPLAGSPFPEVALIVDAHAIVLRHLLKKQKYITMAKTIPTD